MKKYKVTFEIYRADRREIKSVEVEAGNKKLAVTRAMAELSKQDGYSNLYKKVYALEEVK